MTTDAIEAGARAALRIMQSEITRLRPNDQAARTLASAVQHLELHLAAIASGELVPAIAVVEEEERADEAVRRATDLSRELAKAKSETASAVAAERKTTPDWSRLVQCILRVMDHPHKGENSTEQAERIATAIENRFAMDSAGAVAAERERCIQAAEGNSPSFNMSQALNECRDSEAGFHNGRIAAAKSIRALSPKPASGEFVVVPRKPTEAMIEAGEDTFMSGHSIEVWTAMLNAATKDGERA